MRMCVQVVCTYEELHKQELQLQSSEPCFLGGKGEGRNRGRDPSEIVCPEEGEALANSSWGRGFPRNGLGRSLPWFYMDRRYVLLILLRAGEGGERWGHTVQPVGVSALTAGSRRSCLPFSCASVFSSVQ